LLKMEPSLAVVQALGQKPVYRASELFGPAGSRATAYRFIRRLQELGLAAETQRRGHFTVRSSAFQPYQTLVQLLPSLRALKQARYFGRAYDESDVNYARRSLRGMATLDYRAYELTRFQTPHTFFVYAEDPDQQAKSLRSAGFSEGSKGRVAICRRGWHFRERDSESLPGLPGVRREEHARRHRHRAPVWRPALRQGRVPDRLVLKGEGGPSRVEPREHSGEGVARPERSGLRRRFRCHLPHRPLPPPRGTSTWPLPPLCAMKSSKGWGTESLMKAGRR